jgi:hypothetical protein
MSLIEKRRNNHEKPTENYPTGLRSRGACHRITGIQPGSEDHGPDVATDDSKPVVDSEKHAEGDSVTTGGSGTRESSCTGSS